MEIHKLLEAFDQVKTLLPLETQDDYSIKHASEIGYTPFEVESAIKKLNSGSFIKEVNTITWDCVIDLFLSNKVS